MGFFGGEFLVQGFFGVLLEALGIFLGLDFWLWPIRSSPSLEILRHYWAIPENIHTYTTDGFLDFRRGGGVHDYGIPRAWGGIYVWKSKGMGGFHRWDFLRRKCTVSSLKTLSLWTFIVRK